MEKAEQIRERLREMTREGGNLTMLAQVKSVDEQQMLCDLYDEDTGVEFYDVRLRPVIDGNESITVIPKIGTWILAVRIEDADDWMLIAVGECDKVHIKCENIVINGGQNGGLLKWPDAKTQYDFVKDFIAAVKQVASVPVNEPGSGAPSAFQAALNAVISSIQTPSFDGLENEKVKH